MGRINKRRVTLGALAGGVVLCAWSTIVNALIMGSRYLAAQQAGELLKQPRYVPFPVYWYVTLFLLAYILAWLYASVRGTLGPGPRTALKVGWVVGFAAAFPINLLVASWAPFTRIIPLWWMIGLWVGAILATFVAGWLYKD